jgi:hypothetical protein
MNEKLESPTENNEPEKDNEGEGDSQFYNKLPGGFPLLCPREDTKSRTDKILEDNDRK